MFNNKCREGFYAVQVRRQFIQLVSKQGVYPLLSGSKMEVNVGAEVTFLLPEDQTCHFERFFAELERDQYMLGIETYGLSITTMEEVCTTRLSKYQMFKS